MSALFSSGHVVDLILVVLALEIAVAFLWAGGSDSRRRWASNLAFAALPGACLLLALRAALIDLPWQWVGFWLIASYPAHLADLWRRGRSFG